MKVLIADDAIDMIALLQAYLKSTKIEFDLKVTNDGNQAFDTWRWFQPDLVITDYDMPHCNGAQLALKIKAAERLTWGTKPTKLVLLSGNEHNLTDLFDHSLIKGDVEAPKILKNIMQDAVTQ